MQIDELISRRWPTQQKEEKIQQEYSSFSEKIHNNLQDSLEQTSIQQEVEGQKSSVFQEPVKLTVQFQGEAVSSFSQKMKSIPFTSEELAESAVQKAPLNQQSFLGKNMLMGSGDNTAKLLQEDSKISSVDSKVTENKTAPLLTKQQEFVEQKVLKEFVASAAEAVNATRLLQKESEIAPVDGGVTESEQSPLLTKQQEFVEQEVLKESVASAVEVVNATELLQEDSEIFSSVDSGVTENKPAPLLTKEQGFVEQEVLKESVASAAEVVNATELLQEDSEIFSSVDSGVTENKPAPLLTKEQGFVEQEVLKESVASAAEAVNVTRLLQKESDIVLVDGGVIESKQSPLLSKQQSFLKREFVENIENRDAELLSSMQLLHAEAEGTLFRNLNAISLSDTEYKENRLEQTQSGLQPLLENLIVKEAKEETDSLKLEKLVQEEFASEISSQFQKPAQLMRLFQEGTEHSLSQTMNSAVLASNGLVGSKEEQGQSRFRFSLEKKSTDGFQEEGGELAKLARVIREGKGATLFPPNISDVSFGNTGWTSDKQGQIPSKQQSLARELTKESKAAEPAKVFQEANSFVLPQEVLENPLVTTEVLETADVQPLPKQGGLDKPNPSVKEAEVLEAAGVFQEARNAALPQGELANPVVMTEVLEAANVQQPPKQEGLDKSKPSVKEAEVLEPAGMFQEARNAALPQGKLAEPVVMTEVLETANVQQPPKQEGLDKPTKPSVKEAEALEPAEVFQEAGNAALPQGELANPLVMMEVLEAAGVQQPPKQEGLDKSNPSVKEPQEKAAELVNSTQLFQEIVRTPFINGKAVETKEGSGLFNLKNSLEKRFTEIGKGKAGDSENSKSLSEEETKEVTAVLLDLSNQVLALQQLQENSASFSEISQMLGQFFSDYGNVRVQELPPEEMQKLTTHLQAVGTGQLIVNTNISIGQILNQWTADVSDAQLQTEQVNLFSYSKESFVYEGTEKIDSDTIKDKKEQEAVSSSFTESLSGALDPTSKAMRAQGNEPIKQETILSSDLDKTLKQKVEEIQKFVVKNERIFLQLNPERLGTVEVYLKKQHDSIQVHVQTSKEETQKQLDIIFEDIKAKLKEQDIQIEITYTERERQERQEQRGEQREQEYTRQQHQEQEKQQENPFKQLWEGIEND